MYNGEMEKKSVQTQLECQNEAARNELHVNLIPNVEQKKKTVLNLPKYDLVVVVVVVEEFLNPDDRSRAARSEQRLAYLHATSENCEKIIEFRESTRASSSNKN